MTSVAKTIELRPDLTGKRYRGMRKPPQYFFRILPSYHTFADKAIVCKKISFSQNLTFGDLL